MSQRARTYREKALEEARLFDLAISDREREFHARAKQDWLKLAEDAERIEKTYPARRSDG